MKIEQFKQHLSEQISQFNEHLSSCQSAAAVCQFVKNYDFENGCKAKILLNCNHSTREQKAFIQLSESNKEVEKIAKEALQSNFAFLEVSDVNKCWIPSRVCSV